MKHILLAASLLLFLLLVTGAVMAQDDVFLTDVAITDSGQYITLTDDELVNLIVRMSLMASSTVLVICTVVVIVLALVFRWKSNEIYQSLPDDTAKSLFATLSDMRTQIAHVSSQVQTPTIPYLGMQLDDAGNILIQRLLSGEELSPEIRQKLGLAISEQAHEKSL